MNTFVDYNSHDVGMRLRALRENKGYTRAEAAAHLGISLTHLRHLERGDKTASIDLYIQMTELYQSSLDYMILGRPVRKAEIGAILKKVIDLLESIIDSI